MSAGQGVAVGRASNAISLKNAKAFPVLGAATVASVAVRLLTAYPPLKSETAPVCALTTNPPPVSNELLAIMIPNVDVTACPLGTNILTDVSSTSLPPALAVAHLPLLERSSQALVRPALNFSVQMRTINPVPPIGDTPGFTPGPIRFAAICGEFMDPLTAHDPPTPSHASCPESVPCP